MLGGAYFLMRWRVLVSAPRAVAEISRYEAALEPAGCHVVTQPTVESLTEAELLPIASDVDGVIYGDDQITACVLDAAARLRVICKRGTGTDSIDVDGARSRGIAVCNVLGDLSDPVADSVRGYILLFARQLDRMSAKMNAGFWRRRPLVLLSECTLSIAGLGRIGTAVAGRAAAFGMRTPATTPGSEPSCDEVSVPGIEIVPRVERAAIS